MRTEKTRGQRPIAGGEEPVAEFFDQGPRDPTATESVGDDHLVHVCGVVRGLFFIKKASEKISAVVDSDQEAVLGSKLNLELCGQEQAVQSADLFGAECVADPVRPALRVFVGHDHFTLLRAARGGFDECRRIFRFEVGVGESGEEVILVLSSERWARRSATAALSSSLSRSPLRRFSMSFSRPSVRTSEAFLNTVSLKKRARDSGYIERIEARP